MKSRIATFLLLTTFVLSGMAACARLAVRGPGRMNGPLRVCSANPRYFTDASGRAIYLTGSHTWNNLVDMGESDPPPAFDFPAYLDMLANLNHNFIRMWTWELSSWDTAANREKQARRHFVRPLVYARTGPGLALDGKPKFDLNRFDPEYFQRLRERVAMAGDRGIYVSVMLFEGWGVQFMKNGWKSHPFNGNNNINGIEADANGDGIGTEVHELGNRTITELQERYVRKVIDTVNEFDNVLYEISNENHPASTPWQYHMINFIHEYEKTKPKQHPVGMTFQYKGGRNADLFASPAEWISPNFEGGYRDNPPPADGKKVVLNDTDHLGGIWGNRAWVWKSFTRGHNPIFMDPYDERVLQTRPNLDGLGVRKNMGYTLSYARRMDLTAMTPQGELASSGFCLANPGKEYLVYLPTSGPVTVDLSGASRRVTVEWFDPKTGETREGGMVWVAGKQTFDSPFPNDAVLYIRE